MTINFDIFKVQISESVWNFDTCVVQCSKIKEVPVISNTYYIHTVPQMS